MKLEGLNISRRIINQATGRDAVEGPVRVDFEGKGPAEKVTINGDLLAPKGAMKSGAQPKPSDEPVLHPQSRAGSDLASGSQKESAASEPNGADIEVVEGKGILPGETKATLTMKVNTGDSVARR